MKFGCPLPLGKYFFGCNESSHTGRLANQKEILGEKKLAGPFIGQNAVVKKGATEIGVATGISIGVDIDTIKC